MNEYDKQLLGRPNLIQPWCAICGLSDAHNTHHIIFKSHGGDKCSPLFRVCGFGNNSGCHGLFHDHRLHIRWNKEADWYECALFDESTKRDKAESEGNWVLLPQVNE